MTRKTAILFACALGVLSSSCVPLSTSAPEALPDGWREYRVAEIRFTGPAELVDGQIGGRDGTAGSFRSDALWVLFESTPMVEDPFGERLRDASVEQVRIDGHSARIGTWRDGWPASLPWCCALYVPDAGWANGRGRLKLEFKVCYRDAGDAELARRIATSVRIAPKR